MKKLPVRKRKKPARADVSPPKEEIRYQIEIRWKTDGKVCLTPLILETTDRELYRLTGRWTYIVSNRARVDERDWQDAMAARVVDDLQSLGVGEDQLRKIGSAEIVEVKIPYVGEGTGWAARVFPWEDVIILATRRLRFNNQSIVVLRHLDGAPAPPARPVAKALFVSSAPGDIANMYTFDIERDLVLGALGFNGTAETGRRARMLANPTLEQLRAAVKKEAPDLIHLSGVDIHQASGVIPQLQQARTVRQADALLLSDPQDRYHLATANELGRALNAGKTPPVFIGFNCYFSGPRLAAMAVAGGARHVLGFQDTIDDALAEQFFEEFYERWRARGWQDLSGVFSDMIGRLRKRSDARNGAGIVLWSACSLLDEARVKESRAPSEDRGELLRIDVQPLEKLNYSLLYNRRPLFDRFSIATGRREQAVTVDVEVVLHVGGADFPYRSRVEVEHGLDGENLLDKIHIPLVAGALRECRENLNSSLFVQVSSDQGIAYRETFPVQLLSADEWNDTKENRRWLPSFIFPRDPVVTRIIDQARRYLRVLNDDPSAGFDGYQGVQAADDPTGSVQRQIRAVWSAILLDYALFYINPPPTYTASSQRLRIPSQVISSNSGTCIDLSLLFAACLEYIGIYPVVFLLPGHAMPGYWRSEDDYSVFRNMEDTTGESFDSSLKDSALTGSKDWFISRLEQLPEILNHIGEGRLVPFESTMVTSQRSFTEALTTAPANVASLGLESMVDIQLARDMNVTPLPVCFPSP